MTKLKFLRSILLYFLIVGLPFHTSAQNINSVVHFRHNSDVLLKSESAILDSLCESKLTKNAITLHLDGYCDSTGNYQYNLDLSERRAKSVLDYLTEKSVKVSCTYFKGHSFSNPVADNQSEDGRLQNRRVHIEIKPTTPSNSGFLIGHVENQSHNKISAKVHIFDVTDTSASPITLLTNSGDYELPLPPQHSFLIISTARGYFPDFQITKITAKHEITAILKPLKKNRTYTIPNMGFVPSEAELLPESLPTLEGLLQLMRNNPETKIRLEGHTNSVRSKHPQNWHIDLSQRRAESIANYLVQNGVNTNRVSSKGFGSTQMIHSDPASTKEQLKMNRRVEVRVL